MTVNHIVLWYWMNGQEQNHVTNMTVNHIVLWYWMNGQEQNHVTNMTVNHIVLWYWMNGQEQNHVTNMTVKRNRNPNTNHVPWAWALRVHILTTPTTSNPSQTMHYPNMNHRHHIPPGPIPQQRSCFTGYAAVTRAKTFPRLLKLGTSLRLFLPCDCTTKTPDVWENPILQSWA